MRIRGVARLAIMMSLSLILLMAAVALSTNVTSMMTASAQDLMSNESRDDGNGTNSNNENGGDNNTRTTAAAASQMQAPLNFIFVARFNATLGQLPEGVSINNGGVYVGFGPIGQIVKITTKNQTIAPYGSWPKIPTNQGFLIGLTFDDKGYLYAGIGSFSKEFQPGIYRLAPGEYNGNATLFATHPNMTFPNGLVFDKQRERLIVTDSSNGALFTVQNQNGTVREWLKDPLLQGNRSFCPPSVLDLDVGANGVVLDDSNNATIVYVANTDTASIFQIPITKDGSAGKPEIFVGPDCANLNGADGMVLDKNDGSLLVAINKQNKIVNVSMNKTITTLASGGILDFPASPAISDDKAEDPCAVLYITNFAFASAQKNLNPKPALLRADLCK